MTVCVREINNKGKGIIATSHFKEGDSILTDEPIVSCQFSWNKVYKYQACEYCMRSLETAEEMCQRLTQNPSICLPYPECCSSNKTLYIKCAGCDALFCSLECHDKAFVQYHQFLCPAQHNVDYSAIEALDETWRNLHYPPETASIMMIVKLIATLLQLPDDKRDDLLATIEDFCHNGQNEKEALAHKLLGDQFAGQLTLLRDQMAAIFPDTPINHWLTTDGFSKLFCLLGMNQQGVGTSSLSIWVGNCDELDLPDEEREKLDNLIDKLYEELEEVVGETFLNCEGAGLYPLQSKCNHSCQPNAEVSFESGNHKLVLKAIRDIQIGEEVCISYIADCELSRSRHSRQKLLQQNYVFTCECELCNSQLGLEDDVTSDEDDYISDEEEDDIRSDEAGDDVMSAEEDL